MGPSVAGFRDFYQQRVSFLPVGKGASEEVTISGNDVNERARVQKFDTVLGFVILKVALG